MYSMLLHSHSGLRWLVLITLVYAVVKAFGNNPDKKPALIAMAVYHLQLVVGMFLYLGVSPKIKFTEGWMKDSISRFYGMEHILLMFIAAILITIGFRQLKSGKFSGHKWMYLIALLLTLAAIPWPFRSSLGAAWF